MRNKSVVTKVHTTLFALLLALLVLSACSVAVPQAAPQQAPVTEATVAPTAEPVAEDAAAPAESITAHPWQWIAYAGPVDQFDVETPARYILSFGADGALNLLADCNRASGSYTAEESAISLEIGPMTRAMCSPDSRSEQFVRLLGGAAIYFFEEGNLFIDLFADGGTLSFAPAPADSLDAQPTSASGMDANLLFATVGNLTYTGPISGDDELPQVMTVGPPAVTAMMCAEDVTNQETAYLNALANVSAWRYDFGFLALSYTPENGIPVELSFAPAP